MASVFIQPDICNGCGYCVVTCPFGVVDKRPGDGRAFKCTFCYDRQKVGLTPACATACPTQSIQFGPLEELRERGKQRAEELQGRGYSDARIYDPQESSVGGIHAFFVILGEPENYNLPPAPEVPTTYLKSAWSSALISAAILFAIICVGFGLH
jgi:formate dehydrogenase iron-sulfur subunit